MLVVDTSVLVEHLRGKRRATDFLRREASRGPVLVPALAEWELWKGAESPRERDSVAALLEALAGDPFVPAMARLAGDLVQAHRREGNDRPVWDLLIAAHALFHEAPLATCDRGFKRVRGLDVIHVPAR